MTEIPEGLFSNCLVLKSIIIDSIGVFKDGIVDFTGTEIKSLGLKSFADVPVTSFVFPSQFNAFAEGLFTNYFSLQTIEINFQFTAIPNKLFYNCPSLELIVINGIPILGKKYLQFERTNINSIGASAFSEVPITIAVIPNFIETLDLNAFVGCTSLLSLNVQKPLNDYFRLVLGSLFNLVNFTLDDVPIIQNKVLDLSNFKNIFFNKRSLFRFGNH